MVCKSHREVVGRADVDWVMIASWNRDHAEQTVVAFEAGKHVFCQKPLALPDILNHTRLWTTSPRDARQIGPPAALDRATRSEP